MDNSTITKADLLPVTIPRELFDFLMGVGEIDGTSFGDLNDRLPGRFWWRALLRTAESNTRIASSGAAGSGEDDVLRCDDCSRVNPVWFAPSDVWNLVVGGPDATDDPGGVLCPICFIAKAEAMGIKPNGWRIEPEARNGAGENISGVDLTALETSARALLDACYHADANEELPLYVDGSLLDALSDALEWRHPIIWTDEQVAALNASQGSYGHPFTCGGDRMDDAHRAYAEEEGGDFGQLIATRRGWVCPVCEYRQNWAHPFQFKGARPNPFATPSEGGEHDR